ncbi:S9 family peptidase [uncultured Prochlorococcus sp.]|uniref:alpha/beta hydrolase family protein n=1 Tax=uncultured Prochlorococcus sp. TaxID=159733 RepID=UPI0025839B7C|nr:prolyl oligopeptidase family serine peptidase [uncultured Prochlorococcus sp.]
MKNHISNKSEDLNKLKNSHKELLLLKNLIFWIEPVHTEKEGINAIFVRPFNKKKSRPQNLTGEEFYIKNSFHGYGGMSYKCFESGENIYIFWIDQLSKSLWSQVFQINVLENTDNYILPKGSINKLTNSIEGNFDGCFCLMNESTLIGLIEINKNDYLYSLNIKGINQDLKILKKFNNFAGDLSSNSSDNLLSWIEWDTPYMPWEKNDLFFAEIDVYGQLKKIKKFSHKNINKNKNVSFFQPFWISEKILVCSEDSSGWWNLIFLDVSEIESIFIKKRVKRNFVEYGVPQWVSGITYFGGTIKNFFCLAKKGNNLILEHYKDLLLNKEFSTLFTSVSDFSVFGKNLLLKGNGFDFMGNIIEIDFAEKASSTFSEEIYVEHIKDCSNPESFWFKGFEDKSTHSFLYRPLEDKFIKPPLLVRAHSGPTSFFDGSYNPEVQYWTSKGFFVAEVNYGGSSGFGKEYRERLNDKWGIVDSYDCKALVLDLLKLDLVDRDKVVIFGNSAGGLTALNCLLYESIFTAAICKYPVIDLKDMHYNTHRFEKNYLNSLVGNFSNNYDDYINRSPINKINKIKKPILLFHGKKDLVISYKQTLKVQEILIKNNMYSEVVLFENEGHGFKDIQNKELVKQKSEKFLKNTLNI